MRGGTGRRYGGSRLSLGTYRLDSQLAHVASLQLSKSVSIYSLYLKAIWHYEVAEHAAGLVAHLD